MPESKPSGVRSAALAGLALGALVAVIAGGLRVRRALERQEPIVGATAVARKVEAGPSRASEHRSSDESRNAIAADENLQEAADDDPMSYVDHRGDELAELEDRLDGEERQLESRQRAHASLRRALARASGLGAAELAVLTEREEEMARKELAQADRVAALERRIDDFDDGDEQP